MPARTPVRLAGSQAADGGCVPTQFPPALDAGWEMPALWACLLPQTSETSCQQVFLPYLSQRPLWSSHLAPQEQLSSTENLLWAEGWTWRLFLKPQPADRTREALSGMHTRDNFFSYWECWECWQKSQNNLYTCFVWVIFSSFSHVFPVEGSPVLTSLIFIIMFVCLFIILAYQFGQNRNVHMHLTLIQLQQKQIFKCHTNKSLKTNKIDASIVGEGRPKEVPRCGQLLSSQQILLLVHSKYKIVSNLFESIPKMLRTRGESPVGVSVHQDWVQTAHLPWKPTTAAAELGTHQFCEMNLAFFHFPLLETTAKRLFMQYLEMKNVVPVIYPLVPKIIIIIIQIHGPGAKM